MPCEPPSHGLELEQRLWSWWLLRDEMDTDDAGDGGCVQSASTARRPPVTESPPEEPDCSPTPPGEPDYNSTPPGEADYRPGQLEEPDYNSSMQCEPDYSANWQGELSQIRYVDYIPSRVREAVSSHRPPAGTDRTGVPGETDNTSRRPVEPGDRATLPEEPTHSSPQQEEETGGDGALAEVALARRFVRQWWRQVSDRRQRQRSVSAPGDGDDEWAVLEPDGLGPGSEQRRLGRPAALRQAAAALRQRGGGVLRRLAAAGRRRLARDSASPSVDNVPAVTTAAPPRPVHAVRCCQLLSPEPDLPLFESVSCDNLAGLDENHSLTSTTTTVPAVNSAADDDEGAQVTTLPAAALPASVPAAADCPPPPYPADDTDPPPPPYSIAVSRPTPAERLLWHGLDADQVNRTTSSPADERDRLIWARSPSPAATPAATPPS